MRSISGATCYSLIDQWQKAIDDYQAALAIKPNDPATLQRLAFAKRQLATPPPQTPPPPTPTPTPLPKYEGPFTPLTVGIGIGVLVLVFGLIIFFVARRNRGTDEEPM